MEYQPIILIVDDEPAGREALASLLLNQGYTLAFAGDGFQTLAKARELLPDLILLDVMMPGMDGFETCRRLRADAVLAEVPVIMVTALDDRRSRLQGIEAGADDFITKPYDRVELRMRASTILRLNRYRRLHERSLFLSWVVENAEDGYVQLDSDDTIGYANPQARNYLGIAQEGSLAGGVKFLPLARQLYHCQPQDAWQAWPRPAGQACQPLYLVQPETLAHQAVWLEVSVLHLGGPASAQHGYVARIKDVTTQVASHFDMHGFHFAVTHKLRTPLAHIVNSLDILTNQNSELSADDSDYFLGITLKGARRLQTAVEDVLQYAQLNALVGSENSVLLEEVPGLVAEASSHLKIEPAAMHLPDDLKRVQLHFSRQALALILGEIMENALKFHPEHAPKIEVSMARESAHSIRIRIRDDGANMPPDQLARVWQPYYQAEKIFTGEIPGMGLGLPSVAMLVWGKGGTCSLRNNPNGPGVVVEIDLPELVPPG